jgi:hypothetical protein
MKNYNENDLVTLFKRSFDLDASLIYIAIKACEGDLITDGLCTVLLCKDPDLQLLALSSYIQEYKPEILIESPPF